MGAAAEVRGSRAGLPRRLPAQSRRAPPRCSLPRSRPRGTAKPQAVHTNRGWLSRDFASTCPHAEHRWLVNAGLTFSTRPGALSSSRRTSSPHPDPRIPRFSPAFCRTFRPGFPRVPFADRVMLPICRSSTRITSKRRAMPVETFSAQSLRRSLSRARILAIACLTRPRRFDPRFARATGAAAAAAASAPARSGRGSAASPRWTGPRRPPRPGRCPRPGRYRAREPARGSPRRPHAIARPGPGSPGRTSRPAVPRGTSGTGPIRPWAPRPGRPYGTPGGHPTADRARRCGTLHPARPYATPGRVARVEKRRHHPGEVPQRLLLDRLGARRPATVPGPRGGELPALLQVTRRALPARRQWACCSTARFHTYRACPQWSRSTACWAGVGNSRYRDMRTHYRMPLTFPGGDAAFPARPEGRGLHAAILMNPRAGATAWWCCAGCR